MARPGQRARLFATATRVARRCSTRRLHRIERALHLRAAEGALSRNGLVFLAAVRQVLIERRRSVPPL